jgi:rhodanese-related sulfurtransferase
MSSHQAARRAAELGYARIYVMSAGIDGWRAAGKPVEPGSGPAARP